MDPPSTTHIFPSIEPSFRFHPHVPLLTYTNNARPPIMTPGADQDPFPPKSATTIIQFPDFKTTEPPMAWITSLIPNMPNLLHTAAEPTATSTTGTERLPTSETDKLAPTAEGLREPEPHDSGMPAGAKIGIAMGVTVTVILTFIAIGMCVLDVQRRMRKRREERMIRNQDSELTMWVNEMRGGRAGGGKRESKAGGLWADLKIGRAGTKKEALKDEERKGNWNGNGGLDYERNERQFGWLPAYMPRERTSVVSVGSLGLPIMNAPAVPRSFLDLDEKK